MSVNIKAIDFQRSLRELKKGLSQLSSDRKVLIGIQKGVGRHSLPNGSKSKKTLPLIAEVGAWNHFGTKRIPARPFLDVGVESVMPKLTGEIRTGVKEGRDPSLIIERVGLLAVGGVKSYMTALKDPPNATSTIKRKGSSNPLIDTGELRRAITYKVVK